MERNVCCECGRSVPVRESDAGNFVFCSCSSKVVVPDLVEFEARATLVSASTIERRVMRLLQEGELPLTHCCQNCGLAGMQRVVDVGLECETATVVEHSEEVSRTNMPFVSVVTERHWQEVLGRDTGIPMPISLCPECYRRLTYSRAKLFALVAFTVFVVGVLGIVFGVRWGETLGWVGGGCLALMAPLSFFWMARAEDKREQRRLKDVLRTVPPYGPVVARYPHAIVHVSAYPDPDGPDRCDERAPG